MLGRCPSTQGRLELDGARVGARLERLGLGGGVDHLVRVRVRVRVSVRVRVLVSEEAFATWRAVGRAC